jgi:hypothetical protein
MLTHAIYSYFTIAVCLCQATALPFPRILVASDMSSPQGDKAVSLLEFDVLLNGGLLSGDTRGDDPVPQSSRLSGSKSSLIYQKNDAPSVSLFQENWQYEDYMRDWYDDEEDDTDYFSET